MTNLEAKQEAIKKAYGDNNEIYEKSLTKNGWLNVEYDIYENADRFYFDFLRHELNADEYEYFIRPKSLSGIDDNNGWIRIESEDDLPKVQDSFYVCFKNGEIIQRYFIPNNKHSKEDWRNITHWQPIEKPLKPLY